MAGAAKLVVLYPYPKNVDEFERLYTEEHAPMVTPDTMKGLTKFVATRMLGTPDGATPKFYRMAELHFPSLDALKACAPSEGGKKPWLARSRFRAGATPAFLIAEEETRSF